MGDQPTVLVCMLVSDVIPRVPSRQDRCKLCERPVWVAASSPEVTHYWCVACAKDMVEPESEIMPPTAAQIAEIKRKLE